MEDNRGHVFDAFSSLQLFAVVVDVNNEWLRGEDEKHFKGMFGLFKLTELTARRIPKEFCLKSKPSYPELPLLLV